MRKITTLTFALMTLLFLSQAWAQDYSKYSEDAMKEILKEIAVVEHKILVPMRDGVGLSTDIYRPKESNDKVTSILVKTPYNMNVLRGSSLRNAVEAVSRGYAYILQN